MKNQKGIKLGIAWYREDQWKLLRSTASDAENIEDTYHEWLQSAKGAIKKLRKKGLRPVQVDLDVTEFNDWCRREGRIRDAASRSIYTAELLQLKEQKK